MGKKEISWGKGGVGTAGLCDGMKADLVVFNPDTVRATATFEDPKQFPVGIDHVLVNGHPVIHNGAHTGAHPGRALRRV